MWMTNSGRRHKQPATRPKIPTMESSFSTSHPLRMASSPGRWIALSEPRGFPELFATLRESFFNAESPMTIQLREQFLYGQGKTRQFRAAIKNVSDTQNHNLLDPHVGRNG